MATTPTVLELDPLPAGGDRWLTADARTNVCACCLAPPARPRLLTAPSFRLQVPYCAPCLEHLDRVRFGVGEREITVALLLLLVIVASPYLAGALAWRVVTAHPWRWIAALLAGGAGLGGGLVVAALLDAAWVRLRLRLAARPLRRAYGDRHADWAAPVRLEAGGGGAARLIIADPDYARRAREVLARPSPLEGAEA